MSSTTIVLPVVNVPDLDCMLFAFGFASGSVTLTGVGDTVHPWTVRTNNTTDGTSLWMADCPGGGDLTGKSITATFGAAAAEKAMYVGAMRGVYAYGGRSTLQVVLFNGVFRNVSNTVAPGNIGDLFLTLFATTDTADTGFTAVAGMQPIPAATGPGYWSGTGTGGNFLEGQWMQVPDTAPRAPNGAAGVSSPTGYGAGSFWYKASPTPAFSPRRMPLVG